MLEKIRKLLALAADPSAAPQEAETAARQAAKLMAKHDIDLDTLEEAQLKEQWDLTSMDAVSCRPGKKDPRSVPGWIGIIAFGVKVYTNTRLSSTGAMLRFKGPRSDVEFACWLHKSLLDQCYTQSKGLGQGEANAFRNGFAAAVQSRLKAMAKAMMDERGTGTSLIRVDASRQAAMDEAFGSENKARSSSVRQSALGREAGSRAHIGSHRPLTSNTGRLLK